MSDWASAQVELSRELISLARQGGASLEEIRERKRAAILAGKEQAAQDAAKATKQAGKKGPGKNATLGKSQSAPGLQARAPSTRQLPSLSTMKSGQSTMRSQGTMQLTMGQQSTMRSTQAGTRRGGGWAIKQGDDLAKIKEKIDEILGNKSDIDHCEEPYFRTALWEASWKNHEAIVRLLVAKGASISHTDYQGRTPLHEAAFYGHVDMLKFLIDSGHPINCADVHGQTPLFRAVEGGRHEAVRLLVENGAQTNQLDEHGVTVQHLAAFRGEPTLAQFLLHSGAYRHRYDMEDSGGSQPRGLSPGGISAAKRLGTSKGNVKAALKAGATLMFA